MENPWEQLQDFLKNFWDDNKFKGNIFANYLVF